MAHIIEDLSGLEAEQEKLIYWLLHSKNKSEAARGAEIPRRTMYNWLANADFMAKYRAARRGRFDNTLALLETKSADSVKALVDMVADLEQEPAIRLGAAKAVIDLAFKAQGTIAIDQELERIRESMAAVKAGVWGDAARAEAKKTAEDGKMAADHEQAAADCLRVAWMAEIGMDGGDISASLRYHRPQSVAEEQETLDVVRAMLEVEATYPHA